MKETKRKLLALLLFFTIGVIYLPGKTQAASKYPTPSDYAEFKLGQNLCIVEKFDGTQTLAGFFTAPQAGYYVITASNAGGIGADAYLLNSAFQEIDRGRYSSALKTAGDTYTFKKDGSEKIYLNSGEQIYMFAYVYDSNKGYAAINFQIENAVDSTPNTIVTQTPNNSSNTIITHKPSISKKNISVLKLSKCKKGSKRIKGKTISTAIVKIKIGSTIYQIKASSKGSFACKLPNKLKKNQKVTVTVSKNGYNKKVKTIKIK